jgi:LysM repeat protein
METERRKRSPLRVLAPLALIAFGVALVMVISSGGGGGGGGGKGANAAAEQRDLGTPAGNRHASHSTSKSGSPLPKRVYVVKSGDTLGGIAESTGVPVERLKELNPGLDQFSLVAGQRIKLR